MAVAVALVVAVAVAVTTAQEDKLVVQFPPADGQQNCFAFEEFVPQTSTLPALSQILSFG